MSAHIKAINEFGSLRATRQVRFLEVLGIDLVHGTKVFHIGNEDIDLDDLVSVGSSSLQYIREILDDLMLR